MTVILPREQLQPPLTFNFSPKWRNAMDYRPQES